MAPILWKTPKKNWLFSLNLGIYNRDFSLKLPLSWLNEQIRLTQSPADIARMLTMAGLEVEDLENVEPAFQGVVVGRVLCVERHPNADKLCIAQVSDGKEERQVVCGAPNCRQGLLVAWAKPGAQLKDMTIKVAKLRGMESHGMLCAADELGLSGDQNGIMELSDRYQVGQDFAQSLADWRYTIGLTPNLGHCSSVVGVARELAALLDIPYKPSTATIEQESATTTQSEVAVTVLDRTKCPIYCCRIVKGVKVGPSPDWLVQRLELCGIRSVNNVVDATNYVLLEFGHPLHAFDFDKLAGHEIVVRCANGGEKITTLDGKTRPLNSEILMICDRDRPVAVAGVMGGVDTEVRDETVNLLIESAYFQPTAVRRSSKALGLQTDASRRFERGTDPNGVVNALNRVTRLIVDLAGGEVTRGVIDVRAEDFAEKAIVCRVSRVNALLGQHFAVGEIENVFKRLGFAYTWDRKDAFTVSVPTYRNDLQAEIDLIEEVARIYGYDNIEKVAGYYQASHLPHAPIFLFERKVRQRLLEAGLQEFLTCDLIGPALLEQVGDHPQTDGEAIRVTNPTSVDQSILRRSLVPGLLQVVKFNVDHHNPNIAAFEIGRRHFKQGEFFKEESMVAIVLAGKGRPQHWERKPARVDFFDLKGVVEDFFTDLGYRGIKFAANASPSYHPGRQAALWIDSTEVGVIGEVHPAILARLDVKEPVYVAELNLHALFKCKRDTVRMRELAQYPGSERDWTLTLPVTLPFETVLQSLDETPSPLLESVQLIDIYRGESVPEGHHNLTFRFFYRDRSKTLQQETVDAEHLQTTQTILAALGSVAKPLFK
jgi:phenylalanyl-tRNA synthetase beta chain